MKLLVNIILLISLNLAVRAQNEPIQLQFQKKQQVLSYQNACITLFLDQDTIILPINEQQISLPNLPNGKKDINLNICICIDEYRLFFNQISPALLNNFNATDWIFEIDYPPFRRKQKKYTYRFVDKWHKVKYIYNWTMVPRDENENTLYTKVIRKKDIKYLNQDCKCNNK